MKYFYSKKEKKIKNYEYSEATIVQKHLRNANLKFQIEEEEEDWKERCVSLVTRETSSSARAKWVLQNLHM